jgi:hypothetical protein
VSRNGAALGGQFVALFQRSIATFHQDIKTMNNLFAHHPLRGETTCEDPAEHG